MIRPHSQSATALQNLALVLVLICHSESRADDEVLPETKVTVGAAADFDAAIKAHYNKTPCYTTTNILFQVLELAPDVIGLLGDPVATDTAYVWQPYTQYKSGDVTLTCPAHVYDCYNFPILTLAQIGQAGHCASKEANVVHTCDKYLGKKHAAGGGVYYCGKMNETKQGSPNVTFVAEQVPDTASAACNGWFDTSVNPLDPYHLIRRTWQD